MQFVIGALLLVKPRLLLWLMQLPLRRKRNKRMKPTLLATGAQFALLFRLMPLASLLLLPNKLI